MPTKSVVEARRIAESIAELYLQQHGPFTYHGPNCVVRNKYDKSLKYVVLTKRRETFEWTYTEEQARDIVEELNTKLAMLVMVEGTAAADHVPP